MARELTATKFPYVAAARMRETEDSKFEPIRHAQLTELNRLNIRNSFESKFLSKYLSSVSLRLYV